MRTRLGIVATTIAGLLVLTLTTPATGITGNYQKDFVHDYVGLLVFYTDPDPETGDRFSHRCSGTLISSTVIVTAGHCTDGVDTGRVYFQQAVAPNFDPEAFGGLGGDPTTGYPYFNGVTFSRADNYGAFEEYPETRDVGVVVLDEPYTPPSGHFGQLPTDGAIDAYAASTHRKQDLLFRTSGYGVSDHDPVTIATRERLMAVGFLIEGTSSITPYNLKTTANPSKGKGGACNGDSGGPVFFEGTRVIASVVSFGFNPQCKGIDVSYRIDRQPVLDWITDPDRADAG